MEIKDLSKPLEIKDLDFRVQSINKGGYATILVYKDARVDMNRLDEAVGALNWKRHHLNNNHNCIVSIYNEATKEWISKEDTGTESNTEAQKGLASDSFKRACFNWGIGRELYDYPRISIQLKPDEFTVEGNRGKATWNLKIRDWKWGLEISEEGEVLKLAAKDDKGQLRFNYKLES